MLLSELEPINLDEVPQGHPVLEFYNYWNTMASFQGQVVWRDDLFSIIPQVLSWALFIEQKPDGRFYCTFAGGSFEEAVAMPHQGKYLEEVLPADAFVARRSELVALSRGEGPFLSRAMVPNEARRFRELLRGAFGFRSGSGRIDRFILILAPETVI